MVNEEILGGLRSAIERGETLQKAMMTFFNAGYKKEEIEEAARELNSPTPNQTTNPSTTAQFVPQPKPNLFNKTKPLPVSTNTVPSSPTPSPNQQPQQQTAVKQKVSNYENNGKDKALIFILVGVLIILLSALISVFVFKDKLITFFSSFFA